MKTSSARTSLVSMPSAIMLAKTTIFVACGLFLAGCNQESAPSLDQAEKAVTDAAKDATEAVGDAADGAGDVAKQAGDQISQGFAAATEKAASALEGIDGGAELLTKVKELFGSAQDALQGITDNDSAQAAVSKLSDLGGAADSLTELTSKLPDEARTAVDSVIEQGLKQLKTLADKILAMPGVSDVIKPKLDELVNKLTALSGK